MEEAKVCSERSPRPYHPHVGLDLESHLHLQNLLVADSDTNLDTNSTVAGVRILNISSLLLPTEATSVSKKSRTRTEHARLSSGQN